MATSPLYDIYDPDGELRRQAELRRILTGERASLSDMLPEEEKRSMLGRLADAGTSGLGAVGWLFDTPGSILRGALSGGPSKALSALWETSDERVSGRELLRQYGLVGDEDTWANFGAGLAGEVLLDPFTYLNPLALLGRGAATTTGKALQRAGVLEDAPLLARRNDQGVRQYLRSNTGESILDAYAAGDAGRRQAAMQRFEDAASALGSDPAELLQRRAAGSMEFRVPGMQRGYDVSLTGGYLGDALAPFLDSVGDTAKTSPVLGPIVNRATAFFDTDVKGAIDPDAQWRNREASSLTRNRQRDVYERISKLQGDAMAARPAGLADQLSSFDSQRIQNAIADLVEAGGDASRLIDADAAAAVLGTPEWRSVVEGFRGDLASARQAGESLGINRRNWTGSANTEFFPSQSVWFDVESLPQASRIPRKERRYSQGQRALSIDDNMGRGRNVAYDLPMRRQAFRQLMAGDAGRDLQQRLIAAGDDDLPSIVDAAWSQLDSSTGGKMGRLYGEVQDGIAASQQKLQDLDAQIAQLTSPAPTEMRALQRQRKKLIDSIESMNADMTSRKKRLGDLLRQADTQFADQGIGLFDRSSVQDVLRYELGRAATETSADVILNELKKGAVPLAAGEIPGGGYTSLADAARSLGFDPRRIARTLQSRGISPDQAVDEKLIQSLKTLMPSAPPGDDGTLSRLYRSFTNAFKIGALANPAYHARNLYSGQMATLTQGVTNPVSLLANAYAGNRLGAGDTAPLLRRIRRIPRYQRVADGVTQLNPAATAEELDAAILRQFNADYARNRLGQGELTGSIEGASSTGNPQLSVAKPRQGWLNYLADLGTRKPSDWFTVRGVDFAGAATDSARRAPQATRNPLLDLHERTSVRVEDANRVGAFVSALEKGYSPDAAANIAYRGQIDYSPEAFTAGERRLRQFVPFYSYPRGIAPLVAENMIYRPGGLQQQSIRAINRGGESSDEYFAPDYLRRQGAIPIPGLEPGEGLQRFVTNIDLPYAGLINLFSPGLGNTATEVVLNTARQTGMNLLGQLNPAVKYPLENLFNRQLYSGRDLSDLYSVLEQDIGPLGQPLEQAFVNLVPGGTKINAIYRTMRDDRIDPASKAAKLLINNLTGLKVTDISTEQARQRAARDALTQLLETTAGAKTYENITVPEEELAALTPEQRDMYLLYRVIQSDAAKRARERKAAEANPLQAMGLM